MKGGVEVPPFVHAPLSITCSQVASTSPWFASTAIAAPPAGLRNDTWPDTVSEWKTQVARVTTGGGAARAAGASRSSATAYTNT